MSKYIEIIEWWTDEVYIEAIKAYLANPCNEILHRVEELEHGNSHIVRY